MEVMFNVKSMLLIRTTNSPPPRPPPPPAEEQRFVICNWSDMKGQLTLSGQLHKERLDIILKLLGSNDLKDIFD